MSAELVRDLAHAVEVASFERLVGACAHGSLTWGDFEPACNDLDVLIVVANEPTDDDVRRVNALHDAFAARRPEWRQRLDVHVLSETGIEGFKTLESRAVRLEPDRPAHLTVSGRHALPCWYQARERGVPLGGLPPSALIPPISRDEALAGVKEHARSWDRWVHEMTDARGRAYAVLTSCRNAAAIETGDVVSKPRGAALTRQAAPRWSELIDAALATWRGEASMPPGEEDTVRFVLEMRDRILRG